MVWIFILRLAQRLVVLQNVRFFSRFLQVNLITNQSQYKPVIMLPLLGIPLFKNWNYLNILFKIRWMSFGVLYSLSERVTFFTGVICLEENIMSIMLFERNKHGKYWLQDKLILLVINTVQYDIWNIFGPIDTNNKNKKKQFPCTKQI